MFINRINELKWLDEAYKKARKEGQLLVLYGKRRVGKTELVTHFIKTKPHVYYLANRTTKEDQLRSATNVFGFTNTNFPSWREFFDYLIKDLKRRKKSAPPVVLVFDEFPYLAESDAGASSFFQYGWDMGLKDLKVVLIIMGSSISMMYKHALIKSAPLYGRRTGQWLLEPFSFAHTKKFYPHSPFTNVFSLYAISGGIPAYARVFDGRKSLKENIMENILPEGRYLSVEPELLLSEEFDDARSYLTILQAIGLGRTKFSEILQKSQLASPSLPVYLQNLIDLRLIKKEVPVTEQTAEKSKKGFYSLSDPFLRFYFSFIFPNASLIKNQAFEALFKEQGEILTQLVAKTYEDSSAEFIKNAGFVNFDKLGRWWDKDTEIDLVGINKADNAILFAETKWNNRPVGTDVLGLLKKKAESVLWGDKNRKEYFALISKSGFTDELLNQAKDEGVVLIKEDKVL
ncbi:MAG: ATP-binding protein [bacterium]|nr:ATP-binding protein [bacterium]